MNEELVSRFKIEAVMFSLPSVISFTITGVVYFLQVIPADIFRIVPYPIDQLLIVVFFAPFLSVITINIAFISMIFEALSGKMDKTWLLPPLFYFGGYGIALAISHLELAHARAEIAKYNSGVAIPFSQSDDDIVFVDSSSSSNGFARTLVSDYGLAVAYDQNRHIRRTGSLSYRIARRGVCDRAWRMSGAAAAGISVSYVGERGTLIDRLCVLQKPETPKRRVYIVSTKSWKEDGWLLPINRSLILVEGPDGAKHEVRGGHAAPLFWFPIPIIGCGEVAGVPRSKCGQRFARDASKPLAMGSNGNVGDVYALSAALGLKPTPAGVRFQGKQGDDAEETDLLATANATIDEEYQRFLTLLAEPTGRRADFQFYNFPLLMRRPDMWSDAASRLSSALRSTIPGEHATRDSKRVLANFIARLPAEAYQKITPELVSIVKDDNAHLQGKRADMRLMRDSAIFVERLGDAGTDAQQQLVDLLRTEPPSWRLSWAALGLCRAGSPVARSAQPDLVRLLNAAAKVRNGELHRAVFFALLRLGFKDAAIGDPNSESYYKQTWYADAVKTLNPSSPRSSCKNDASGSGLPD